MAETRVLRGANAAQLVLTEPIERVSLKRAAWAYGCAKKGSDVEKQLLAILWRVIARAGRPNA